jgi:ribosomal protein S18 acetylase RimI-like enzyme
MIWYGKHKDLPKDSILLCDILVNKEERSKGYGKTLIEYMHNHAIKMGYKNIFLNVSNINPAMKLYSKIGYSIIESKSRNSIMLYELKKKSI